MTNKWTVNGVEAPEGAEFYGGGKWWKHAAPLDANQFEVLTASGWHSVSSSDAPYTFKDYMHKPCRIDIIAISGNDGEHYSDYAFCLSEAINKLKHCADVAPDDKRKDALLEIVDEVEFIKSEGDK